MDVKTEYSSTKAAAPGRTPSPTLLYLWDITVFKTLTFELLVNDLLSNQLSGAVSLLQ